MKMIKTSLLSLALLTLLLGLIYPLVMWGIGELIFNHHSNGSLYYYPNKEVLGSELIAQNFTTDKYFQPRPSSAGNNGYDASHSSGNNLGPTSQRLIETIQERVKHYRSVNKWNGDIPADAVTGSGSGLDPHISVQNARIQAARVAGARGMSMDEVNRMVDQYTEGRTLWVFGEKRVNVLKVNLALDMLKE